MIRSLRLVAGYAERSFLAWMAGRDFLVTLVVNQSITPLIGLAVWSAALPGQTSITTYFLALLVVRLMTVSYEHHTLANHIYTGDLADDLLRPHPLILGWIGDNLAIRLWHAIFALPLVVATAALIGMDVRPAYIGATVPAILFAAILRFLFTYTLALSAFWTERAQGVVGLGGVLTFLLGGEAAPVPLLPVTIRPWIAALPFRAMLGFPAELASGSLGREQALAGYGWQLFWTVVLAGLTMLVWRRGMQRYVAVGS